MRVLKIRDQLQELGEIMSYKEVTAIVLNILPEEWGKFTSRSLRKNEATPFSELLSLFKIEETRLKEKNEEGSNKKVQAFAAMARRKGKFGRFDPQKKNKKDMSKIQCYGCHKYGH